MLFYNVLSTMKLVMKQIQTKLQLNKDVKYPQAGKADKEIPFPGNTDYISHGVISYALGKTKAITLCNMTFRPPSYGQFLKTISPIPDDHILYSVP